MEELEEKLSYKFKNHELLTEALTHAQTSSPTPVAPSQHTCDRLKIVGDCVLKLLVCQYAVSVSASDAKLGAIVKLKDELCTRQRQDDIAKRLQLEKYMLVERHTGRQLPALHDTFLKSLLGAVFVDAGGSQKKGFVVAWKIFLKLWKPYLSGRSEPRPLVSCYPKPKFSSREFLEERFESKFAPASELEAKLGFVFKKSPHLLEQALTHDGIGMFGNKGDFAHFQCLEFLGDSVLELVIMEHLYSRYDSSDPLGQMLLFNRETGQKLYSSRFQVRVAKSLQLDRFVIKPPNVTVLSYDDFVESVIGAVYVNCGVVGLKKSAEIVLRVWGIQPLEVSDDAINGFTQEVNLPPPAPLQSELEMTLGIKFTDQRILDAMLDHNRDNPCPESGVMPISAKNLEHLGRRVLRLLVTEHVIGLCPTIHANLSAKVKQSQESLRQMLTSPAVMSEIGFKFWMDKYVREPNNPNEYDVFINTLFGGVFVDSGGEFGAISRLFAKLWNQFLGESSKRSLKDSFPNTSDGQTKFRAGVNRVISDSMWETIGKKLGHKFKNRNLFEQAMTDERSQGCARAVYGAFPTGNPYALKTVGKCAVDLLIASRGFRNVVAKPDCFEVVVERMDVGLFKVLQNSLGLELDRMYAHAPKFTFPPTTNPRGPYYAILGAVYADAGGGVHGMESLTGIVLKICPTLLDISKAKVVRKVEEEAGSGSSSSMGLQQGASPSSPSPVVDVLVDQLNNSFSSKCAANFSFSPGMHAPSQPKQSSSVVVNVPAEPKPEVVKSYATVVVDGKPPPPPVSTNSLVNAVVDAQKKIHELRSTQKEANFAGAAIQQQIAKTGVVPPPPQFRKKVVDGNTTKRKRSRQGKATTASVESSSAKNVTPVAPPPLPLIQQQKPGQPVNVAAAGKKTTPPLQNHAQQKTQVDKTNLVGSSPKLLVAKTLTKPPVPQQRAPGPNVSMPPPQHAQPSCSGMQSTGKSSIFTSSEASSSEYDDEEERVYATNKPTCSHAAPPPVNKVHGYVNEKFKRNKNGEASSSPQRGKHEKRGKNNEEKADDQPSSGVTTVLGVIKFTAIVLGVALLVARFRRP